MEGFVCEKMGGVEGKGRRKNVYLGNGFEEGDIGKKVGDLLEKGNEIEEDEYEMRSLEE